MRLKLSNFIGALKDTTSSVVTALNPSTSSSIHLAVLRATSHFPSTSPPSPYHISVLLSFGRSSRLTASALISSLSSRLHSTTNPAVALKSLLALHILFSQGAFIIKDQIFPSLLRHPKSGRNPLALASFSSEISLSLSAWVRWFARVLEVMLVTPALQEADPDRLTVLRHHDIIKEIDPLVAVIDEISRIPDGSDSVEENELVLQIVKQAEEDWITIEKAILLRVREMKERIGLMSFSDSVELLCALNRVEEMKGQPMGWKWVAWDEGFLKEVKELQAEVDELVVRKQQEEKRVSREKTSTSARIMNRVQYGLDSDQTVPFSSTRWTCP